VIATQAESGSTNRVSPRQLVHSAVTVVFPISAMLMSMLVMHAPPGGAVVSAGALLAFAALALMGSADRMHTAHRALGLVFAASMQLGMASAGSRPDSAIHAHGSGGLIVVTVILALCCLAVTASAARTAWRERRRSHLLELGCMSTGMILMLL